MFSKCDKKDCVVHCYIFLLRVTKVEISMERCLTCKQIHIDVVSTYESTLLLRTVKLDHCIDLLVKGK